MRSKNDKFSITYLSKNTPKVDGVFFEKIKEKILGRKYDLSLVFTTLSHSRLLNKIYREKNKSANILSFPLAKDEGEIFISPKAKKNVVSLFIHGLCHLKGMRHSSKMEDQEKKYRKLFKIPESDF